VVQVRNIHKHKVPHSPDHGGEIPR
jgi:hypothetical protein